MGTPAYVQSGSIYFDEAEDAAAAKELITEWVKNANEGTLPDEDLNGDYNINNVEFTPHCWVSFRAESGRVQNLEWQMENFRDFIKTLNNAVGFEAPIIVESDNGIYWEWEADEEED